MSALDWKVANYWYLEPWANMELVSKFLPGTHPVLQVEIQLGVTPGKIWGKFADLIKFPWIKSMMNKH